MPQSPRGVKRVAHKTSCWQKRISSSVFRVSGQERKLQPKNEVCGSRPFRCACVSLGGYFREQPRRERDRSVVSSYKKLSHESTWYQTSWVWQGVPLKENTFKFVWLIKWLIQVSWTRLIAFFFSLKNWFEEVSKRTAWIFWDVTSSARPVWSGSLQINLYPHLAFESRSAFSSGFPSSMRQIRLRETSKNDR